MRPDWRQVRRSEGKGVWGSMYVTMNRHGEIVMNRLTYQRLGEPKVVNLLFDKANSRIGLQATAETEKEAFYLGARGRHGGKVVNALKLMNDYTIDLPETIQFRDARIDD